jgi:TatD DNase family protein
MYIDSHAHITTPSLAENLEELISRAQKANIEAIVNICTDIDTLNKGLELSKKHPWIFNTAATTPHDVDKEGEITFPVVEAKAKAGQLVAIGETGLDYFYGHSPKAVQKKHLRRYLHLALQTELPVVIHCRDAFSDFFEILDTEYRKAGKLAPGVLHCFTGNRAEALEVIKREWYISFSGIITFKKSHELREIVKDVPLNQMLIETDSPYLAPQSHRGKTNEPAYLPEVAATIADAKGISIEEVAQATASNARTLFSLHMSKN